MRSTEFLSILRTLLLLVQYFDEKILSRRQRKSECKREALFQGCGENCTAGLQALPLAHRIYLPHLRYCLNTLHIRIQRGYNPWSMKTAMKTLRLPMQWVIFHLFAA
jgi:hypothetical protein